MSYYMKFIGNDTDNPTAGTPLSIELAICGILLADKNLADVETFFGGAKRRAYVPERSFQVQFENFSTVDDTRQNTADIIALIDICAKPFVWLSKPTAPKLLPDRWVHTTGFAVLDFFDTPRRVVLEGDINPGKNWRSAEESLELTFVEAE